MKFAVVVFPGSNCDHDAYHAAKHVLGHDAEFVWHKETSLKGADVVVLPSDQPEPFGLVAIEAFARSRPVIASAAGGPLETVTPGSDGWLFPPGDSESLAKVLAGLTRTDVEAAGRRARRTYETRYTVGRFVGDWRRAVLAAAT